MDLAQLTSSVFLPLIQQTFQLYAGPLDADGNVERSGEPVALTLIEVRDYPPPPVAGRRRAFALTFNQSQHIHLPQRIYLLEHAQLGQLTLFLVPIGLTPTGVRYEAIFN